MMEGERGDEKKGFAEKVGAIRLRTKGKKNQLHGARERDGCGDNTPSPDADLMALPVYPNWLAEISCSDCLVCWQCPAQQGLEWQV